MTEEIKQEEPGNGKPRESPPQSSDFKIAEIWIKGGQLYIEAARPFWQDKIRALGILDYCKDIVKNANIPDDKQRIIQPKGSMMNFARGNFKRRK